MANTLHELAGKLQDSIIKQQETAHDAGSLQMSKYNNLKLKMSTEIKYPHVIVTIGISEAIFNIETLTKIEGGLGPEEKYVKKWLDNNNNLYDLKEIYTRLSDMAEANKKVHNEIALREEGEAYDPNMSDPKLKSKMADKYDYHSRNKSEKEKKDIKKDIKNYLKSSFRKPK